MEVISYEKTEMIPLTDKENKSHKEQEVCYICKKEFCINENEKNEFKLYQKVRDHFRSLEKLEELLIIFAF